MDLPLNANVRSVGVAILAGRTDISIIKRALCFPLSTRLHVIPSSRSMDLDFRQKAVGENRRGFFPLP